MEYGISNAYWAGVIAYFICALILLTINKKPT
jgi:hypothetical protein